MRALSLAAGEWYVWTQTMSSSGPELVEGRGPPGCDSRRDQRGNTKLRYATMRSLAVFNPDHGEPPWQLSLEDLQARVQGRAADGRPWVPPGQHLPLGPQAGGSVCGDRRHQA